MSNPPNPPTPYHLKASDDQALSVCDELGYFVKQLFVCSLCIEAVEPWRQYMFARVYIDRTRLMSTAPYISDLSRPPNILMSTLLLADVVNSYKRRMLYAKWPYVFWLWQNTFHWIPVNRKQKVARHCIPVRRKSPRAIDGKINDCVFVLPFPYSLNQNVLNYV